MNSMKEAHELINQMFEPREQHYNPKRIKPIIDALYEVWMKNPHLRLGQLIAICANQSDVFYVEDESILSAIKDFSNPQNPMESK